ncbi:MarR family winged helix-turn-helix transcriptional regulator [Caproicibacter fermentans]|uniref:MarR family transcriptional regulator n=1 Tax=Caproicibacter fermentans TaxID=2576756 RepID=A0A7G8TAN1_9FIRM|nr:MarR family transcriptional regulator [Caproicibacter fermentans]QNK40672.1 MarR family transcriptional regulator [Caproicibacter fermentans]
MNETNSELYEKLGRLMRLLHKHHLRAYAERGPMADPTRGQGRLIAILKMQDGISTKDLSYLLGIRISSLNELLSKMEKAGYIKREPSETDKRVMLVKLTEKGKNEQQQEWNPDAIFNCLSEEEQEAFGAYLDRVIHSIEANLGEEMDEDEREWWMREARERMGDERFERFAAMRQAGFMMRGFDPHGGFDDFHGGRDGRFKRRK